MERATQTAGVDKQDATSHAVLHRDEEVHALASAVDNAYGITKGVLFNIISREMMMLCM